MIYKTKMVEGPNRNFEIFDPLDFLAAATSHIPNRGEHLVRYYGYYSSVQRGRRRRQGREHVAFRPMPPVDDRPHAKAARASWARFIKKIFAADPLVCPDCGGAMRIIAFIENRRVVRAILEHLSLWDEPRPPPALPAAPRTARTRVPALGGVICTGRRGGSLPRAGHIAALPAPGVSSRVHDPAEP